MAWRHLECLENELTAAAGGSDAGPGDIKAWRMPVGGSAWCKACQGPVLEDQMATKVVNNGIEELVHLTCWLALNEHVPAPQPAKPSASAGSAGTAQPKMEQARLSEAVERIESQLRRLQQEHAEMAWMDVETPRQAGSEETPASAEAEVVPCPAGWRVP